MLLRSKPQKPGGSRSTHHFNLPQMDGRVMTRYDIGPEPVEVPDADAQRILKMHSEIEAV